MPSLPVGWFAAASVCLISLVGCTAGQRAEGEDTDIDPVAISDACNRAFEDAGGQSTAEQEGSAATTDASPVGPLTEETEADIALGALYPAVLACTTIEEWSAAYRSHPDSVPAGIDPISALRELCEFAHEPEIADSPLCRAVAREDVPNQR